MLESLIPFHRLMIVCQSGFQVNEYNNNNNNNNNKGKTISRDLRVLQQETGHNTKTLQRTQVRGKKVNHWWIFFVSQVPVS